MSLLRAKSWSPYAVGAALGVLSWVAFATVDRGLGITTAFENTAALVEKPLLPAQHAYLTAPDKHPKIDWEWMVVVGVFLGSRLSASISGDRTTLRVPALWRKRFGASVPRRFAGAFAGGALAMFGARLAQGCTSGHGITGALQLAVSSWVFLVVMFAVAALVALSLYGTSQSGRTSHV